METIEPDLAARYLSVWSRSVAGAAAGAGAEARVLVVDASDEGAGRGAGDGREPAGHPLVALLAALTPAAAERTTLVVLREDPADLDAAHAALEHAGQGGRVRRAPEPGAAALEPGGVWLVEAGLAAATPALLPLLDAAERALVRLAPATPAALPLATLRALLAHPALDLLLRLPFDDLARLARFRTTPVADLPLHLRRLAEGYASLLGDARWEWLALWRAVEAERGVDAAAERLAEHFRQRLVGEAADVLVRLHTVPTGGAVERLVLATREPERVLELNRLLFDLRSEARIPWMDPRDPAVRLENPGVLDLFGTPAQTAAGPRQAGGAGYGTRVRVVDAAALANTLAGHFDGRSVPLREVMRHLAGGDLFADEVRQVLRLLRREGRVAFTSLRSGADVLRFGADPPGARLPRRTTRRPADPELW